MTKQHAQALACICRHHGLDYAIAWHGNASASASTSDGSAPQE